MSHWNRSWRGSVLLISLTGCLGVAAGCDFLHLLPEAKQAVVPQVVPAPSVTPDTAATASVVAVLNGITDPRLKDDYATYYGIFTAWADALERDANATTPLATAKDARDLLDKTTTNVGIVHGKYPDFSKTVGNILAAAAPANGPLTADVRAKLVNAGRAIAAGCADAGAKAGATPQVR